MLKDFYNNLIIKYKNMNFEDKGFKLEKKDTVQDLEAYIKKYKEILVTKEEVTRYSPVNGPWYGKKNYFFAGDSKIFYVDEDMNLAQVTIDVDRIEVNDSIKNTDGIRLELRTLGFNELNQKEGSNFLGRMYSRLDERKEREEKNKKVIKTKEKPEKKLEDNGKELRDSLEKHRYDSRTGGGIRKGFS